MPHMVMTHEVDPKEKILEEIGDISGLDIYQNQILCAVYVRPEKTKSGLYLTDANRDEDKIQGKVGLLVKLGPIACDDTSGQWFQDVDVDLNDWIVFRPSDGWSVTVNGVLCRMIEDVNVRGKIPHPDMVW